MANKETTTKSNIPENIGSTAIGFTGTAIGILILIFGLLSAGITSPGTIGIDSISSGAPFIFGGLILTLFFVSGFMNVGEHEMGVIIRRYFGEKMPQGQIVARAFKQIGIQSDTLQQGFYWLNPIVWKHAVIRETFIGNDKLGLVTAIDGRSLPDGRLLGDKVDCDDYQDARKFLENGGFKGPQVAILPPGQRRINTYVFTVTVVDATKIREGHLGLIVAKDGKSLPSGYIIAPEPKLKEGVTCQQLFQAPQEFIDSEGYRGPQLATLQPGTYYINTFLLEVTEIEQSVVPPGYVAVITSFVGKELTSSKSLPGEVDKKPGFNQSIHEESEVVLQDNPNERGILSKPVATGTYNLNTMAFDATLVKTSAITIDWADDSIPLESDVIGISKNKSATTSSKSGDFFKFSRLKIASKDTFLLNVAVRLIIRIRPENAPFVIARFGSIANLIEQIAHPLIDSSFRNKAGDELALAFYNARATLQKEAWEKAKEEFDKYHIEVPNLLLSYIDIENKELLETQTKKQIAIQQVDQYAEETKAQEARTTLQEKTAIADKQAEVVASQLSIKIEENKADALRKTADGKKDARIAEATGDATYLRETGTAKGAEVEAVFTAKAKGFRDQVLVLGSQNTTAVNIAELLSTNHMKVVPDITVSGAEGGSEQALMAAMTKTFISGGGLNGSPVIAEETLMKKAQELVDQEKKEKADAAAAKIKAEADSVLKAAETPKSEEVKPEVKPAAKTEPVKETSKQESAKNTGKPEDKGSGKAQDKRNERKM